MLITVPNVSCGCDNIPQSKKGLHFNRPKTIRPKPNQPKMFVNRISMSKHAKNTFLKNTYRGHDVFDREWVEQFSNVLINHFVIKLSWSI